MKSSIKNEKLNFQMSVETDEGILFYHIQDMVGSIGIEERPDEFYRGFLESTRYLKDVEIETVTIQLDLKGTNRPVPKSIYIKKLDAPNGNYTEAESSFTKTLVDKGYSIEQATKVVEIMQEQKFTLYRQDEIDA